MKWKVVTDKDNPEYPARVWLSYDRSSLLQLNDMDCGNFASISGALHFINGVKHAKIQTNVSGRNNDIPDEEVLV